MIFVSWAIAGGPWWLYLGLILVFTGAWRWCPIYSVLRKGTYTSGNPEIDEETDSSMDDEPTEA